MAKETQEQVAPGELMGRRLFGEGGWDSSVPSFDFTHFVDSRLELNLSVDLLGGGHPERRRVRYLTASADQEASERTPITTFEGWAAILTKDLSFPGWVRNVYHNRLPANDFHAEISREGFRQKAQSYAFATVMADRFSRKGRFVAPERN